MRAGADEPDEDSFSLPLILMKSTYKLESSGATGTGFVLAHVLSDESGLAKFVLVTADHVLRDFKGESATIHFRRRIPGNEFTRLPTNLPIRKNGKPLWLADRDRDIAVLLVNVPDNAYLREASPASTSLLASDDILAEYELQPGDELMVLGFPFGADSNPAGFPILRSGRVASYPLLPTKKTKSFLLDFEVYPGNSGGPVFLYDKNRHYGGSSHMGRTRFIAGLVTQQKRLTEPYKTMDEEGVRYHSLALAQISHSNDIRRLIEQLIPDHPIPDQK